MSLIENIKRDAGRNGSTIQSSESLKLEGILNQLLYLDKNIEEETAFVKQVMTRGLESTERVGLHASSMIVSDKKFCYRQQVLSLLYKQLQGEQLPVGLMRVFEEGNAIHEKWQRLLIRGGYAKAKALDYTRFDEEYKLSYTPDIICRIPEFYNGLMVGEIKSVNTFQFKKMTRHPSAYKQLQFYMHLLRKQAKEKGKFKDENFKKGFVLCEDKNTQELKIEVYDYDPEIISSVINRCDNVAAYFNRLLSQSLMVGRHADCTTANCKMASECPMKDACYNIGMGRVRI